MNAFFVESIQEPQEIILITLPRSLIRKLRIILQNLPNLLPNQLRNPRLPLLTLRLAAILSRRFLCFLFEERRCIIDIFTIDVHNTAPFFILCFSIIDLHVLLLTQRRLIKRDIIQGTKSPIIPLNHAQYLFRPQPTSPHRPILPHKTNPQHPIPLIPTDSRSFTSHLRLDTNNARFDLRRRFKVVLAYFHNVRYLGPELRVDGKPAVEGVAGACGETQGEFALEH